MSPTLALPGCQVQRCPNRVTAQGKQYCVDHSTAAARNTPSRSTKSYDRNWQRLRKMHLNGSPLCVHCEAEGRVTIAQHVDHITPIAIDPSRRLDPSNLQSLCISHHSAKTRREQQEQEASTDRLPWRG